MLTLLYLKSVRIDLNHSVMFWLNTFLLPYFYLYLGKKWQYFPLILKYYYTSEYDHHDGCTYCRPDVLDSTALLNRLDSAIVCLYQVLNSAQKQADDLVWDITFTVTVDITYILTVCVALQCRPGGTDSPGTAEWLTCPGLIQALVVCLLLHQPASPTLRPILHAWPRPRRLCVCYKTTAGSCYCQDSNIHRKDLSDSNTALSVRDGWIAGFYSFY